MTTNLRKRVGGGAVVAAVTMTLAGCGGGSKSLGVSGVWSRSTADKATTAAIYLKIENPTGNDDALVAVSVPSSIAMSTELHKTSQDKSMDDTSMDSMTDDVSAMTKVDTIVAMHGKTTELKPGGYHVMLKDLAKPLVAGQHYTATLKFEKAGTKKVTVDVKN